MFVQAKQRCPPLPRYVTEISCCPSLHLPIGSSVSLALVTGSYEPPKFANLVNRGNCRTVLGVEFTNAIRMRRTRLSAAPPTLFILLACIILYVGTIADFQIVRKVVVDMYLGA